MNPTLRPAAIGLQEAFLGNDQDAIAAEFNARLIAALRRQGMSERLLDRFAALASELLAGEQPHDDAVTALRVTAELRHEEHDLMRALSRLGLLYDLAGLTARANMLDKSRAAVKRGEKKPSMGGPYDMSGAAKDVAEAIAYLNRPIFEVVMTAHPTNVNSLESVRALRHLGMALTALRLATPETLLETEATFDASIDRLLAAPVLPERIDAEGHLVPGHLSVRDETKFTLRILTNLYEDTAKIYNAFDMALEVKAGKTGERYDPMLLKLRQRFSSWGSSGDKDGNAQVNADTTLEAIGMHRHAIYALYAVDLQRLSRHFRDAGWVGEAETLALRARECRGACVALKPLLAEIGRSTVRKSGIEPKRFDQLAEALSVVAFDVAGTRWFLEDQWQKPLPEEVKTPLLTMVRRMRTFRDHFARIEYRETAREYTRVVDAILSLAAESADLSHLELPEIAVTALKEIQRRGGYLELAESARRELLGTMLESGVCATLMQLARPRIEAEGCAKPYSPADALPIAYHTIKRMELARDFPAMIVNNVLAECEEASHALEAQFLQEASLNAAGARAILGIVPLFEAPEVMLRVDEVMRHLYENPSYRRHLATVAAKMGALHLSDGALLQQVQFAHSDNTRRAGLPAARALIFEGHLKVRAVNRQFGIATEFFEGGSHSDPFRGGVRSIPSMTNMYGLHDFMKFTFQGGDLINYFNDPKASERLYTRNISHAAKVIYFREHGEGAIEEELPHLYSLRGYDEIAMRALIPTRQDYRDNVFEKEDIGFFLGATRDEAGNVSSRASSRSKAGGEAHYIDATKTRTITFSESFQHAGIVPTFLGALTIEQNLHQTLLAIGMAENAPQAGPLIAVTVPVTSTLEDRLLAPKDSGMPLDPEIYRHFYRKSCLFRDVIDRVAFGVAMTDLDHAAEFNPALAGDAFIEHRLKPEYIAAARLSIEALSPPGVPIIPAASEEGICELLRDRVRRLLPHLAVPMRYKSNFMTVVQRLKRDWGSRDGVEGEWIRALSHACNDIVTHGIFPTANDPKYAALLFPHTEEPLSLGQPIGAPKTNEAA